MAKIIFYPNGLQDSSVTSEHHTLANWVVTEGKSHDVLCIWENEISRETEIKTVTEDQLTNPDGVYHISPVPMGPAVWIPIIVSVVIGVVATLLLPSVDIPEAANHNQTSSNALQNRANQPRLNKRLPSIRGTEVKAFPDLWMSYNKFLNNQEFEVSYMCLSDGMVMPDQDTIRDGDTKVGDIRGQAVEFYAPFESPAKGSTPFLRIGPEINEPLVAVRQSNEVDGAELEPPNKAYVESKDYKGTSTGRVSGGGLDYTVYYNIGDQINLAGFYSFRKEEPLVGDDYYVRYDLSGSYSITSVEADYVEVELGGAPNGWQYVSSSEFRTSAYQDGTSNVWWFSLRDGYTLRNWITSTDAIGNIVVGPFDCSNSEQVWLNLVAQNGLYKKNKDLHSVTLNFEVLFADKDSGATQSHTVTMSTFEEEPVQSTFEFSNPYTNCDISVKRLTDTDKEFEGSVVDTVKWRDLYLVNSITKTEFGNVTTILAQTRATTSALRVKERKLSMAATRYITRPDGTPVYSDEFADVVFNLHTDPYIGRSTADTIDYVGLYALQEEIVSYYGRGRDPIRVGYTFDDDKYRYEDHLRLICDAVNVTPYRVGNVLKFFFDGPQQYSVQQFGHRSKDPNGTETRTRSLFPRDDYDGVELTYKDETTGDYEVLYVPSDQSATNPEQVEYKGCFVKRNAEVKAMRVRNKQLFQRVAHEFVALDKARLLAQGQRVDVIDNTRFAPNNGYIDTVEGLTYYLSQETDISVGTEASIVLTRRDGSLEGVPCKVVSADSILLAHPPAEAPYVGYYADRTEYSLSVDDQRSKMAMLVTEIIPEGIDQVSVTAINYDERYYKDDK